ncbi:MAG: sigma-70 family RNA polymerase sigma factor [Phycisphaeraceae bacterium]|nr:sigma-70 family RNA polymerase sigma factor [Phycisphaeraceae bacterium]
MPVDQKTITSVLLRDRAKLLAYIGAIVRDQHVAEDVLQEVSMLAIEKQGQIKDADTLLPWLRVTARFRSLKAIEKRGKRPALMDSQMLDVLEPHWQKVDHLAAQETNRSLDNCVKQLAPQAQRLIELRYGAGLSVRDIGQQLSRKTDTLYKTYTRIHAVLQRCMRKAQG